MDFSSRSPQPAGNHYANPNPPQQMDRPTKSSKASEKREHDTWYRVGVVAAIVAVVALLVGVCLLLYANNNNTKDTESSYIKDNKLQAVFLETGQVYFGNISTLNNNFLVLNHIFYLQTTSSSGSSTSTTSSTSGSNVTLVKLGCELHMPYDQMVINRNQVTFWENLQSSGQVATAVAKYNSEHPDGQTCTAQTNSSASTSSNVQNATGSTDTSSTGTTSSTTGTGTTTTTK
jgi:hypothetical protein